MIEDVEGLFYQLQRVIDAERNRIANLRDSGDQQFLVARGRLEAWMAVSRTLGGIDNALLYYEANKDEE